MKYIFCSRFFINAGGDFNNSNGFFEKTKFKNFSKYTHLIIKNNNIAIIISFKQSKIIFLIREQIGTNFFFFF